MFNYNQFYEDYVNANSVEQKKLLEELKVVLYFNYRVFFSADSDTASDFFCEFFEQVESIVSRYSGEISCFFVFFRYMVRMYFNNFVSKMRKKELAMNFSERACAQNVSNGDIFSEPSSTYESMAAEPTLEYNAEAVGNLKKVLKDTYFASREKKIKSQCVERALLLRYGNHLGEQKTNALCSILDVDSKKMFSDLKRLNEVMHSQKKITSKLESRIAANYCRFKTCEKLSSIAIEGSAAKDIQHDKAERAKIYWEKACEKYLNRSLLPTYSMISDILNINRVCIYRDIKKFNDSINKNSTEQPKQGSAKLKASKPGKTRIE